MNRGSLPHREKARFVFVLLAGLAGAATAQQSPDAASKPDAAAKLAWGVPAKPALKTACEDTLAAMANLRGFDDGVLRAMEQHLAALSEHLVEAGELAAVARLNGRWGTELAHKRGRPREALLAYRRAEEILQRLGDQNRLAVIAQNAAAAMGMLSLFEDAIRESDKAAAVFAATGNDSSLAQVTLNRGLACASLGRLDEALATYDRAEQCLRRLDDRLGLAQVAQNRSLVRSSRWQLQAALQDLRIATAIYEELDNPSALADMAANRATILVNLSRHEEALREYENAAATLQDLGDQRRLAQVAQNRSRIFRFLGRPADALAECERAAAAFAALRDGGRSAAVDVERGLALADLGHLPEAMKQYEHAGEWVLAHGSDGERAVLAEAKGLCLAGLERFDDAAAEYASATRDFAAVGDDVGRARVRMLVGSLLAGRGRHAEALDEFSAAAALLATLLQTQVQGLGEASSSAFRASQFDLVGRVLRSAVALPQLTAAQCDDAYRVFGTMVGLGMAEAIAERGAHDGGLPEGRSAVRWQELTAAIGRMVVRRDRARDERGAAGAERREQLDAELRSLGEQMQRAELECSALIEEARQRQQVRIGVRYPMAATTAQVQAELDPGVALLEFAMASGELFAFVTTKGSQRLVGLGKDADVRADVGAVVAAMATAGAPPDPALLRRLGARLLDPLLALLPAEPRIDTLLVAAQGELARLPFEILALQEVPAGAAVAAWPLLLRRFDVAYVHSGTVLRAMRLDRRHAARAADSKEFVAFAFPIDAGAQASVAAEPPGSERADRVPLPGSASEALEIAQWFAAPGAESDALEKARRVAAGSQAWSEPSRVAGAQFEVLLRAAATEQALKQLPSVATARILHLACHAEADLTSPSLSRLVLARTPELEQASGQDGYVYLGELRDLDLHAELLVLSACGTNTGKVNPVDGVTGLSRAGLASGAEAVVATFWRVEDDAARTLVVDFYRRWLGGTPTRIAALNAAKRAAMDRGLPLRTWSAYALWDARTR